MGFVNPRSQSDANSLEVRRVVGLAVQALPLQPTRGADFRAVEAVGKVGVELGLLHKGFSMQHDVYYFTSSAMDLREYCVMHDDCLVNPELGFHCQWEKDLIEAQASREAYIASHPGEVARKRAREMDLVDSLQKARGIPASLRRKQLR